MTIWLRNYDEKSGLICRIYGNYDDTAQSTHKRLGQAAKAQASSRAAISSDSRYDLELADGSWMDSRRAARLALRQLDSGQVLSLR